MCSCTSPCTFSENCVSLVKNTHIIHTQNTHTKLKTNKNNKKCRDFLDAYYKMKISINLWRIYKFKVIFTFIRLQLYAFSPHPSTPPQLNPPPSPTSTLPLDFVHDFYFIKPGFFSNFINRMVYLKYSWPLNNTGLNYTSPDAQIFFNKYLYCFQSMAGSPLTMPFCIGGLRICGFVICEGSWNQSPMDTMRQFWGCQNLYMDFELWRMSAPPIPALF